MCEAADAPVVKTSAVCTSALACAGGIPIASIAEVEMTPNAMPSAPSTICAANPIASSNQNSSVMKIASQSMDTDEISLPSQMARERIRSRLKASTAWATIGSAACSRAQNMRR